MKILIVDDDKDIVELLSIYVENEGYEVEKAYNGKEALSKLNMNPDIAVVCSVRAVTRGPIDLPPTM